MLFTIEILTPMLTHHSNLSKTYPRNVRVDSLEVLTEEYCENLGFTIDRPENSDHDSIINGKKVEIKGSFRWVVDGELKHYRWQQIRPSQTTRS